MKVLLAATFAALLHWPASALACACGCDVFDVGGDQMLPTQGGEAYIEYNYMDQNQNWAGAKAASSAANADKEIKTNFVTAGASYAFNMNWGVIVQVPVWNREFRTENDAGTAVDTFNHAALGDIRLMAVYTGLSKDMSTGLIFGVKLPTGDWRYPHFDRDTSIGTGSTNLLIGGYHTGGIGKAGEWSYFAHVLWDVPVAAQGGYRPGQEVDGAIGVTYNGRSLDNGKISVTPLLQAVASTRNRDSGVNANPGNSGYGRLLISPGLQLATGAWKVYGDVEFPVYIHSNGNQLIARQLFKVVVSRRF
jgi:hypothetical protein